MKFKKMIKGSIHVRVKGKQIARFLSVLASRGILYENVIYEQTGIVLDMPAKKYKEAVICGKKTGMKLKILTKQGVPFFLFRYRREKWILCMILLPIFFAFLYLPCFIWSIEINGLEHVNQIDMLMWLEELGVEKGVKKNEISLEMVENQLLLAHDELSFLSLSMDGSTLVLLVDEAVSAPEMVKRTEPCDLVTNKTAIIYSIVTEQGTPLVQTGDVVQAGEVLIAGEVIQTKEDGSEESIETHAAGRVYGKSTWYSEAEIQKQYIEKVYDTETKKGVLFRIENKKIEIRWPFGKTKNESSIEEEIWRSPLTGRFSIHIMNYERYECKKAEYTENEMKERLREKLYKEWNSEMKDDDKIILAEEFKTYKTSNGMKGVLVIEMIEDIATTVPRSIARVDE